MTTAAAAETLGGGVALRSFLAMVYCGAALLATGIALQLTFASATAVLSLVNDAAAARLCPGGNRNMGFAVAWADE